MASQQELTDLAEIKSYALALRKFAEQVVLKVEKLERAASPGQPVKKKAAKRVRYTEMILGGRRATKQNTIL